MANTLLTPSVIAKAALATLYANAVMPQLVHRDFDSDFDGQVGDTITIRKPATFTSSDFGGAIVVQDATETGVPVVLNHHLDVSFAITTKDLALSVEDFQQQFLAPAMEAHAQKIDQLLLALRSDITQTVGTDTVTPANAQILVDARKKLNDAKVAMVDRHAVLATATEASFLKDPLMVNADQRGDTVGLVEASLGRKYGFDLYADQNITNGDSVAFHRSAFALVSRTLPKPLGVASEQVATVAYKGFGLRVVRGYDINAKKDVVSIDCLVGVKTLDANRACVILG
jgi:hypothetical protein